MKTLLTFLTLLACLLLLPAVSDAQCPGGRCHAPVVSSGIVIGEPIVISQPAPQFFYTSEPRPAPVPQPVPDPAFSPVIVSPCYGPHCFRPLPQPPPYHYQRTFGITFHTGRRLTY